jgi:putative transposase
VINDAFTRLEPLTSAKKACELLGKARATLYRQRNPRPARERDPGPRAAHPAALSAGEQEQLLSVLNGERFADKSPAQAWAVLLDEGIYLASVSTMYRVLRAADQIRERRAQAAHPPRARPELTADGPSQIWSQDITKLKGPARGIWFDLFVMLDIFSRKAIRWEVHATENAEIAKEFIDASVISNGGIAPNAIHADRGTSMTSKPVSVLLSDLHISQSHSRPHVSNDNPYSEAQFKTLKYCPAFPGQFGWAVERHGSGWTRLVNAAGIITLGNQVVQVGSPLAGQRARIRLDGQVMHVITQDGVLWRTLPCPIPPGQRHKLQGVRLAGPQPLPPARMTIQRKVSSRGGIQVARQRIQAGFPHAGKIVTIELGDTSLRIIDDQGELIAAVPRRSDGEISRFKAYGTRQQQR